MQLFDWLEHSDFSMWVKDPETLFGYNMYLASHGVGMAILVGLSSGVALRILGFAPRVPLGPMEQLFPVMFAGFWLNVLSGLVLFIIYPLKPIGNPGFYIKIGFVVAAVVCLRRIHMQVFGNPAWRGTEPVPAEGRRLAGALLFIWAVVITAGRLMAYHGVANVERQTSIAMVLFSAAVLLAGWVGFRLFARRAGRPKGLHYEVPGQGLHDEVPGKGLQYEVPGKGLQYEVPGQGLRDEASRGEM